MTLHVYRLEVLTWPTDDGRRWDRVYGYRHDEPAGRVHWDDEEAPDEVPDWALAQAGNPLVAHLFNRDPDGEVTGVCMPRTHRQHFFSGTSARQLAEQMRAFGAVVRLERSDPVTFAGER